jgi:hypothetical protein
MEQMYPTHVMEFLALSEHPFDVAETFEPLPTICLQPSSDTVYMVEQMRPRCTWRLVQTKDGLRRCAMPSLQGMFRNALRTRLPNRTYKGRMDY